MRPHPDQYLAVKRVLDWDIKGCGKDDIWHTTESGKTLTSVKAAQIVIENPKVDKVGFVLDRLDLDYQITKVFNLFWPG